MDGWPVVSDSWPAHCLPLGASVSCEVDVKSHVRRTDTVGLPGKGTPELVGLQRMWQVTGVVGKLHETERNSLRDEPVTKRRWNAGGFTWFQGGRPAGRRGPGTALQWTSGKPLLGGPSVLCKTWVHTEI